MKNYTSFAMSIAAAAILATSCATDADETASKLTLQYETGTISEFTPTAPVTIRVNDFAISVDEYPTAGTRAEETVATYDKVKAITLAFYDVEGTEKYKHTQLKADNATYTTFGEFTCDLPVGSYTMVVLGYGSDYAITLTSPTAAAYTEDKVRETFSATQSVTITSTAAVELAPTLHRIVSKFQLLSTDPRPAGVSQIKLTFAAGGQSFNPTTGLATDNSGFINSIAPSAAVGTTINTTGHLFLATDEQKIDVTIEVLDADDNVLFTKQVKDVPFKRNRLTTLSGAIFTAPSATASFKFETSWLDPTTVQF